MSQAPLIGNDWDYWFQICSAAGGNPLTDDSEWNLVFKFVSTGMENPKTDDDMVWLLKRYLYGVGIDDTELPVPDDSEHDLLRKLYKHVIGSEAPSIDNKNDLLRAIANHSITAFPVGFLDNSRWSYASVTGSGTAQIALFGSAPAGSDGFKVRYRILPTDSFTVSTLQGATDTYTITASVGDTLEIQVALFLSSTQVSDWSRAKRRTLA